MKGYVFQAELDMGPYEPSFDIGLYEKRADAKAACQDDHTKNDPWPALAWEETNVTLSRAKSHYGGCSYYVTRRRIHTTFTPTKKR